MPKKRKRGVGLANRKKYQIKGRSYYGVKICENTPMKSNEDMHESQNLVLSSQREVSNFIDNRNHCFQTRQRMAIVYAYEHTFGNLHPDEWKSFDLISKLSDIGEVCYKYCKLAYRITYMG